MPNEASGESLAEVWGPPCIRHSSQPEWWCGRNTLPAIWGGGKAAAIGATSSSSEENNAVSMLLIEPIMDIARGEGAAASDQWGRCGRAREKRAPRISPQVCRRKTRTVGGVGMLDVSASAEVASPCGAKGM